MKKQTNLLTAALLPLLFISAGAHAVIQTATDSLQWQGIVPAKKVDDTDLTIKNVGSTEFTNGVLTVTAKDPLDSTAGYFLQSITDLSFAAEKKSGGAALATYNYQIVSAQYVGTKTGSKTIDATSGIQFIDAGSNIISLGTDIPVTVADSASVSLGVKTDSDKPVMLEPSESVTVIANLQVSADI